MKLAETAGAVLVTIGIFTSQLALILEGLPV